MGQQKTKFTGYYDLLSVPPDASAVQLKKAYHKAALRLHPDKGGDPKTFQEMKDAYDVLSDPAKRKMYDTYGPEMIKIMNGNGSPEDSFKLLGTLGKRQRLCILSVFLGVTLFILLFPIFLALRWDGTTDRSWALTFIPLWVLQLIIIIGFYSAVQLPSNDEASVPEEDKKVFEEIKQEIITLQVWFGVTILLLVLQQVLIVLKLDEEVSFSWMLVFLPWTLLCIFHICFSIALSPRAWKAHIGAVHESDYEAGDGNATAGTHAQVRVDSQYIRNPLFYLFVFERTKWKLLWLVTSLLSGAVAEGLIDTSFFIAATPLLAGLVLKFLYVWSEGEDSHESNQDHDQSDSDQPKQGVGFPVGYLCCITGPALIMLCLTAAKLDDSDQFSAFLIFLPLFVFAGCLCCVFSLVICSVSPEMFERMEEEQRQQQANLNANQHGGSGSSAVYGAVNHVDVVVETKEVNIQTT